MFSVREREVKVRREEGRKELIILRGMQEITVGLDRKNTTLNSSTVPEA